MKTINLIKNTMDSDYINLTYQDFYEDKILLIEYDLTPEEILIDAYNGVMFVTINNREYYFCPQNRGLSRQYFQIYVFEISFSLESLLKPSIMSGQFDRWMDVFIKKIGIGNGWRYHTAPSFCLNYKHTTTLNWEEITDKSYLDFIIKSAINYVKLLLKEFCERYMDRQTHLKFMKQFNSTNRIQHLFILVNQK